MKQLAYLEYKFLFDPSETWAHVHEFESGLADYLSERGLEAQFIETVGTGTKIMLIKKKPDPVITDEQSSGHNVKEQLKSMDSKKLKT
jgi:hypothetical protein